MNEILNVDELKFKVDDESLAKLNENPEVVWKSEGNYVFKLPFDTQQEFDESVRCLLRNMYFSCFTKQYFKEHENEKRLFEYIPVDVYLNVQFKITDLPKDKHIVVIGFKIGMRYLDEKPSEM
jgi:hypothetical protein